MDRQVFLTPQNEQKPLCITLYSLSQNVHLLLCECKNGAQSTAVQFVTMSCDKEWEVVSKVALGQEKLCSILKHEPNGHSQVLGWYIFLVTWPCKWPLKGHSKASGSPHPQGRAVEAPQPAQPGAEEPAGGSYSKHRNTSKHLFFVFFYLLIWMNRHSILFVNIKNDRECVVILQNWDKLSFFTAGVPF